VLGPGPAPREAVARARGREVDAVLGKPVDPAVLAETIRGVLGARRPA
jgi:hypothetical protein